MIMTRKKSCQRKETSDAQGGKQVMTMTRKKYTKGKKQLMFQEEKQKKRDGKEKENYV
jgi:hypothetical protein